MPQSLAPEKAPQDSKSTIAQKAELKEKFCQNFDLTYDKKVPLLCITYPLSDKNEVQLIQQAMEGILEQKLQIAIVGVGTQKYQEYFTLLAERHPDQVVIVEGSEESKEKLYAAADMLLCPSDSRECAAEISRALESGVVPLTVAQEEVEDYSPVHESGNAFIHQKKTCWSLFANLIRALENFKFPYDWKNIVKAGRANLKF